MITTNDNNNDNDNDNNNNTKNNNNNKYFLRSNVWTFEFPGIIAK